MTDDGWLETPERGLHELAIGTGEYLAASGLHSIAQSPLAELGRMAGLYAAGSGPNANAPDLPIDQARERIKAVGLDQVLHVDGTSIKAPVLDLMMANAREKREREATIARGPSGFIPTALAVGTSFFAGALDPINVGATMIPVVGEARAARLLAAAGESIVGRTAVRAGIGGVQGASGMVPLEGLNWLDHTVEGQDWQMTDALRGIAFGGVLGAGLHASLGALSDRAAPRPGDPIEAAVEHIKAAEGGGQRPRQYRKLTQSYRRLRRACRKSPRGHRWASRRPLVGATRSPRRSLICRHRRARTPPARLWQPGRRPSRADRGNARGGGGA
jgi:hypothetical protein